MAFETHSSEAGPQTHIPLEEGKTKIIYEHPLDRDRVIVHSKDAITAGDGAKREVIPHKGVWANRTNANVFTLLNRKGIPTSFIAPLNQQEFEARACAMIPLEVVIRRQALGSYLKRNPDVAKGSQFEEPLVELYLKTKERRWGERTIPTDDPMVQIAGDRLEVFEPQKPIQEQEPFLSLNTSDVLPKSVHIEDIAEIAEKTFLVLEEAWQKLGIDLADMKIEFGITGNGRLVVSDVIDNDSWRLLKDGTHLDKQVFRDGGDTKTVGALYEKVARLTEAFTL